MYFFIDESNIYFDEFNLSFIPVSPNVCFDQLKCMFWYMSFALNQICVLINLIFLLLYISKYVFWSTEMCILKYVFYIESNVCFD